MDTYYAAMPEQFYSGTGLPVITPASARAFVEHMVAECHTADVAEIFSGSSSLTLGCYGAGLRALFPADFRYGWDLRRLEHRQLYGEVLEKLQVKIVFFSPRCSPWSIAGNQREKSKTAAAQEAEVPTLRWVTQLCKKLMRTGMAFMIENPRSSSIFKLSPLQSLVSHHSVHWDSLDQCQFGAAAPDDGLPIRKRTTLVYAGIALD